MVDFTFQPACRVKKTFANESDALPEGERLRIGNGISSATLS